MGPREATDCTSWANVHVGGRLWKVLRVNNSGGLFLLFSLVPRLLGYSALGAYGLTLF